MSDIAPRLFSNPIPNAREIQVRVGPNLSVEPREFTAAPTAAAKQFIPANDNILAYTDIVQPNKSPTIYFTMPQTEGVHPFVCTFAGHWIVMSGFVHTSR